MAYSPQASSYGKYIDLQNYTGSAAPTSSGSLWMSGTAALPIFYANVGMDVDGTFDASGKITTDAGIEGASLVLASGATCTAILDEDAMGSNSATALATQQSIKAYVDAQVSGLDIDSFTDGSGVTIADGDKFLMSDGGTEKYIEASQLATYVYGETAAALTVTGLATFNGNVDLGDATGDTITATGRFDSDLVPSSDSARDLGSSALQWAEVHADAGHIDAMTVSGTSTLGAVTATTISGSSTLQVGGAISGNSTLTMLGLSALQAVTATTFSGSSTVKCGGNLTVGDDDYGLTTAGALEIASMAANWTNASRTVADMGIVTTIDINGGNIDGTVIGAASVAAGSFAALVATTGDFSGNCTFDGNVTLGDASSDVTTVTSQLTCSQGAKFSADVELDENLYVTGLAEFDGAVTLGNASGDAITVTGAATFAAASTFNAAVDVASGGLSANSLKVDDLTDTRLLLAGTSGEVEDSDNLKYDGSTFDIAAAVEIDGNVTLDNDHDVKARSFITYSDAKLKTNVETVTNAMDMIQGLRGVSYDLKTGGKREFGFIAQEVNTVVPEVVSTSGNTMGIDYTRITSLLVEAVKTQQVQIEALKAKLDK